MKQLGLRNLFAKHFNLGTIKENITISSIKK